MRGNTISSGELEKFLEDFKISIPQDIGYPILFIEDGDLESTFNEAKEELNNLLSQIKIENGQ